MSDWTSCSDQLLLVGRVSGHTVAESDERTEEERLIPTLTNTTTTTTTNGFDSQISFTETEKRKTCRQTLRNEMLRPKQIQRSSPWTQCSRVRTRHPRGSRCAERPQKPVVNTLSQVYFYFYLSFIMILSVAQIIITVTLLLIFLSLNKHSVISRFWSHFYNKCDLFDQWCSDFVFLYFCLVGPSYCNFWF